MQCVKADNIKKSKYSQSKIAQFVINSSNLIYRYQLLANFKISTWSQSKEILIKGVSLQRLIINRNVTISVSALTKINPINNVYALIIS